MYADDDEEERDMLSIEEDPEIAFLAEQELAEEDPGILRFIQMEKLKHMQRLRGDKPEFPDWPDPIGHGAYGRSINDSVPIINETDSAAMDKFMDTIISTTEKLISSIKSIDNSESSSSSSVGPTMSTTNSTTPTWYVKKLASIMPMTAETPTTQSTNQMATSPLSIVQAKLPPKKKISYLTKKIHQLASLSDPRVLLVLTKQMRKGKLDGEHGKHQALKKALAYLNAEKYLQKKIYEMRQVNTFDC